MPQKASGKKIEKKKPAANRHGKTPQTKKGNWDLAPKSTKALTSYLENKELTRTINAKNELHVASKAQQSGGKLKTLKAPLPIHASKDAQQKKTGSKAKEQAMQVDS